MTSLSERLCKKTFV